MKEILKKSSAGKMLTSMLILCCVVILSGCSNMSKGAVEDMHGSIIGSKSYLCRFYSDGGINTMNVSGKNIDMKGNNAETSSSVITLNVDKKKIETCGSTILFVENGLTADADFSADSGLSSDPYQSIVNRHYNDYKNANVVIIQSQTGIPLCAYSGKKITWQIDDELPKTTKISIDGKLLYIHRANFQLIEKELLKTVG